MAELKMNSLAGVALAISMLAASPAGVLAASSFGPNALIDAKTATNTPGNPR